MKKNNIVMMVIVLLVIFIIGFFVGSKKEEPTQQTLPTNTAERKIMYYRNPMGLADISQVPKKDSMGMDYIPVYEGEAAPAGQVHINIDKVQKIGVKSEKVVPRTLTKTIRAVGVFRVNEQLEQVISPRFNGWIETLYVNKTGQVVKKNQPLMSVYSPELIATQQDFLLASQNQQALQGSTPDVLNSNQVLMDTALQRLRYWDISEDQIQRLKKEGKVQTLTLNSPTNGVVLEKNVRQGIRFTAGDTAYIIADLSTVWVIAEIFEQDLNFVHQGQTATIHVNAYPNDIFTGMVDYVYPTTNASTRTTQVRIELANADYKLKPDMYADIQFIAQVGSNKVLAVPNSAIIKGGIHNVVLIQHPGGLFEPRNVELGAHADDYTQVLSGLNEGEEVVVRANFLIDAESNLKAALSNFTADNANEAAPGAAHGAH